MGRALLKVQVVKQSNESKNHVLSRVELLARSYERRSPRADEDTQNGL